MRDTTVAKLERSIASTRVVLSVTAIVSVYIDPTIPNLTRWLVLTGGLFKIDAYAFGVMGLHLLYAASVYATVVRWPTAHGRIARLSTWADVLFSAAIAVVTEGATSPSSVFFAFAILAVGCRAGLRRTLEVTAVCVALYLALILVTAHQNATYAYLMRPTYLALMGYLIGYLGQQRLSFEERVRALETQTERHNIARALHDGYVQALAGVNLRLESCRELLCRRRADDALAEITELQGGVRREYDEVRAYLRSLVDLEGREATDSEVTVTQFTIHADFGGSGIVVERTLQIMLEGMRNVRQHAHARSAAIDARTVERHVRVTVDDDGVGFDSRAPVPWTIASRVAEVGGEVRIVQAEVGGAHLSIDIPEA